MKKVLKTWSGAVDDGITLNKEYEIAEGYFKDDNGFLRREEYGTWQHIPSDNALNGGYPPIDTGETFLKHKDPNDAPTNSTTENSGGSCSYYDVTIKGTTVSCQNIIEALGMDFNEGTAFKSVWRKAAARQGKLKEGNTALRDAEKVKFYGDRMIVQESNK